MEIITYFPAALISYLGLLLGIILIVLAPEEQKPGKKYFIILKKILFLTIILFLLLFYNINLILSLALLALLVLLLNKRNFLENNAIVYFLLGILFFLSSKITNLFVIESILIFMYGIPTASLIFNIKKKNYYETLIWNILFFLPVTALYFIF